MRGIVVALVVLAGLLVVADRGALAVAEHAAATTLQQSQHLDSRPSVGIAGFPFLTQLASGHYDKITVRADGLQVGDQNDRLRIARLEATLRDVHVSRNFRSGRSATTTARALIAYRDLGQTLGARFGYAGNGRVRASATVTIAGVAVSGSATASVRLSGDRLVFGDQQVEIGNVSVPAQITQFFSNIFSSSISLAGLPFGVQVHELRATAQGIVVALTAQGLTFSR